MPNVFIKDPSANLDYVYDWSDWLSPGETISSVEYTVPAALASGTANTNTATTVTVWLAGGTAGMTYRVSNRITTNQGRVDERTFSVHVEER
ncbi:hypothetical protein [Streptomyces sioyaensis]|uniref:phage fiber-tail adaptor protein n=1 Tax=Streptomyces sioyaensis TaxID=67364 RepID=UPI003D74C28D